jgi:hypothetical protein
MLMRDVLTNAEMRHVVPLVRARMKAQRITARALVKSSGYAERTIRYLINYGAGMSRTTVSAVCKPLGIDLEDAVASISREGLHPKQPGINCGFTGIM